MLQQPELEGLAHKRRRRKNSSANVPAASCAVAHVMLDVQAPHLGHTFDYLIPEKYDEIAQPGSLIRVRFGSRRVNGIIWSRSDDSHTTRDSLRFIERVLSHKVLLSKSMRSDIVSIANAYGGTPANIIRLAVPPRIASVEEYAYSSSRAQKARITNLHQKILPELFAKQSSYDLKVEYDGSERVAFTTDERMMSSYSRASSLKEALSNVIYPYSYLKNSYKYDENDVNHARSFVIDALPGSQRWAQDLAWIIVTAINSGRQVAVVLPTLREINDVMRALMSCGLQPYKQIKNGEFVGDVVRLSAADAPADRYRSWIAVSQGIVPCVLGTRAAMYAPVEGDALFVIVEDAAYQQADGMQPYAQARGVMRLRAKNHGGIFISMSFARSMTSHYEIDSNNYLNTYNHEDFSKDFSKDSSKDSTKDSVNNFSDNFSKDLSEDSYEESDKNPSRNYYKTCNLVTGKSELITPFNSVRVAACGWVRWLNRESLAKIGDDSAGLRVPDTAKKIIKDALKAGYPVLLSIPEDGTTQSAACVKCHHQARCRRCTGPIDLSINGSLSRCAWCGASTVNWSCTYCSCKVFRAIRVGAAGTVKQLSMLFPGTKMIVSSPHSKNGIVSWINEEPMIVVATPGSEPRVKRSYKQNDVEASLDDDFENDFKRAAGDDSSNDFNDSNLIYGSSENTSSELNNALDYKQNGKIPENSKNNINAYDSIISKSESYTGEYRVVAFLDAWASLYTTSLDGNYDVLSSWMRASSACAPKSRGGCVMILGESDSSIVDSLTTWDSSILATRELSQRKSAGLPPTVCAACVWGNREDVMRVLNSNNFNLPTICVNNIKISPLLGVVPMHNSVTEKNLHFNELHDRVKAVVRVPLEFRNELVKKLRKQLAEHSAFNYKGELHFSLDPKDLLAY